MRNTNVTVLSASDSLTTNGIVVDSSQLIGGSFLASFSDTQATGTLVIQGSNDNGCPYVAGLPHPTNWMTIPNMSASITSGASAMLLPWTNNAAFRWIRAQYTNTATGAQTIAPIADTGVKQVQTVTTVSDVSGSLNSTYFLLSSVNTSTKAQKNFYMWFDNGSGVDPLVAGRTAIHITYTDNATGSTLATAMRTALNALSSDFVATGASTAVIITSKAFGPVTAAVDGLAPTGFTFGSATAGVLSNLNNTWFYLQDTSSAHLYYVWNNVDSIGTDPLVAGRTGVPIAFASGSTAATIGTALTTAIAALNSTNSFTVSGTTTVTVTNKTAGPFVPMTDGTPPTQFTFAVTAGGSGTITVNMNAVGF